MRVVRGYKYIITVTLDDREGFRFPRAGVSCGWDPPDISAKDWFGSSERIVPIMLISSVSYL